MNLHRKAIWLIYTFRFEYVCCIRMPSRSRYIYMPEWVGCESEVKDMIKKYLPCRRRSRARGWRWRRHPPINLGVRHDCLAERFFVTSGSGQRWLGFKVLQTYWTGTMQIRVDSNGIQFMKCCRSCRDNGHIKFVNYRKNARLIRRRLSAASRGWPGVRVFDAGC